ncbi:MAG: pyruvate, phosphate dikinase [Candidatus Eiseniibacteriota bacterium]
MAVRSPLTRPVPATGSRYFYSFGNGEAEGDGLGRDLLGGKGAGLADMTRAGVPVPPGFTITTEACRYYYAHDHALPEGFEDAQEAALVRLEEAAGKRLRDPSDPLLVSVRSGAKISMPGMMDTILNLGLNDRSVEGLARRSENPRFAWDCYRRFLAMFGNVVLEINKDEFEQPLAELRGKKRAASDSAIPAEALAGLVETYKKILRRISGRAFPQDPRTQLRLARDAVFRSWMSERAVTYRRIQGIPDDLGTAVNVQAMVFGNLGDTSGTGVGFTRDPATGEHKFYGEYLVNAQGEDVVAGIRTPHPIAELAKEMPGAYRELVTITQRLEKHYRDVQDFEFTIQDGKLYLLQTRTGKRTGAAAVKIAVDMVGEGLLTKEEALLRVEPESLNQLLHRRVDPDADVAPIANGLAASPGAAVGRCVFTADDAERWAARGEKVVLVRKETVPDDIGGMVAAQGILTSTGGTTSHAAVVARGMGKCCVVGASGITVDEHGKRFAAGDRVVKEGEVVSLDGARGLVFAGAVPTLEPGLTPEFARFLSWADEARHLRVRANADIPRDAKKAREFGAEGIGLCRTEHMFFAEERLPVVVDMIFAANETWALAKRVRESERELDRAGRGRDHAERARAVRELTAQRKDARKRYEGALATLLPFQRSDFKGLFEVMDGYGVTIRTLDPPLHEFLPKREVLIREVAELKGQIAILDSERVGRAGHRPGGKPERRARGFPDRRHPGGGKVPSLAALKRRLSERERLLARVEEMHEFNPMLGHRGVRLGITYPEVTAMQARAILEAAVAVAKQGKTVLPEIMIPLVGHVNELTLQAALVRKVADDVFARAKLRVPYLVGTMIEVPRAALTAGEIATQADFFSFGTNDLTQMVFGFSRDDAGSFLPDYVAEGVLPDDPFVTLDREGVGRLVRMAVDEGRAARRDLKIGICGEHGGEPQSVAFCHDAGLDYVSCSPFRVPIARLAAAQAALRAAGAGAGNGTRTGASKPRK